MSVGGQQPESSLKRAVDGDSKSLAHVLEHFRPLLLKDAVSLIDDGLRPKVAPSDLVQTTLLCACVGFAKASFTSLRDVKAWLRGIMNLELKEVNRSYRQTKKRDIRREKPFNSPHSRECLRDLSMSLSASGNSRLERHEQIQTLSSALERLPPHYRQIIHWRNIQGRTFAEIAEYLDEEADAVRMLFNRAIARLKKELRLAGASLRPDSPHRDPGNNV